MDQNQQPQSRELVYCHQCENEWYRDEHGIICPECQSDFTEIIEANHDPRDDEGPHLGGGGDFYAPDPDEDDIDNFAWTPNGPGQPAGGHFRGTFERNINLGGGGQGTAGQPGMIGGLIGSALQSLLGGTQQQRGAPHQDNTGVPGGDNRSVPGSPQQGQQEQQRGNGGTFVRHGHGPGFHYTITTSSGGNLFPRDANQPQPFQGQPDHLENMMRQMFMNIGAMPGPQFGGPMHTHGPDGGPVFVGVGGGGMRGANPIPMHDLFSLFGMPHGGVHGDAVYSQEGLDRIITQLMEQHQAGNAPGPASTEAIEALPKRKITEKDTGDGGKADCSICMDEAEIGSEVTELPCSHWFHHDCIRAWLTEHDTCPHCRQGIMPKEGGDANRPRQPNQQPLNDMHSPEYQQQGMPGEYPFPRTNSSGGEGSRQHSSNGGSAGGMFSRMREAFSPSARTRNNPSDSDNYQTGESGGNGTNDGR